MYTGVRGVGGGEMCILGSEGWGDGGGEMCILGGGGMCTLGCNS